MSYYHPKFNLHSSQTGQERATRPTESSHSNKASGHPMSDKTIRCPDSTRSREERLKCILALNDFTGGQPTSHGSDKGRIGVR